jgi:hypothetical protein
VLRPDFVEDALLQRDTRVLIGMHEFSDTMGLTSHIRRNSSTSAACLRGRPPRGRDFQRQNHLNSARCQAMTVSGWKRINALRQFGHHPFKTTHNNRSLPRSLGLCADRLSNASWCQRAESPRRARVSDEGRTTGSAGAPRQSRTWLISLRTNPTESTTSLRDEVSATDSQQRCVFLQYRYAELDSQHR